VAVPIGGIGELERQVGSLLRLEQGPVAAEQLVDQVGSDQLREEVVNDDPLVVPRRDPAGLLEDLTLGGPLIPEPIDGAVVGPDVGNLELAHEQVDVVARIADQRNPLVVARDVVAALPQEQLGGIVPLVEVGRADRARAVDRLEVGARDAEVADSVGIRPTPNRRAVGRDVVGDELAEERPPRGHRPIRRAVGGGVIAEAPGAAQRMEPALVDLERRKIREEAAVAPALPRVVDPLGGETLVARGCGCDAAHS
jgi:hypothetical protein